MIKFIVLLTSAITFNFTLSFGEALGISSGEEAQEIQLVFSEKPIGIESGQPVYPLATKVFVKATEVQSVSISINGSKEIVETSPEVDISNYINPHADTYTVVIEATDNEDNKIQKIFGFTIQ